MLSIAETGTVSSSFTNQRPCPTVTRSEPASNRIRLRLTTALLYQKRTGRRRIPRMQTIHAVQKKVR